MARAGSASALPSNASASVAIWTKWWPRWGWRSFGTPRIGPSTTPEATSMAPKRANEGENVTPDDTLDLRGVVCPINFVQTKLKLEEMELGQVLELILDD